MLNHIWAFLIVVGVLFGFGSALHQAQTGEKIVTKTPDGKEVVEYKQYVGWKDKAAAIASAGDKLTNSAFNSVAFTYTEPSPDKDKPPVTKQGAVGMAVGFIGMMALWLGFMKIAEASGLIQSLAKCIAPIFRFLFPTVPVDSPAAGAMLMNIAANMLGLDNAATPLGIKAMKELQKLNGQKDTASNAMCMFLALNVSCLTLLPATVIGWRVTYHSQNPTAFWFPMLIAMFCGNCTAVIVCKICERFSPNTPPAVPGQEEEVSAHE